jgi:hypothetical protein
MRVGSTFAASVAAFTSDTTTSRVDVIAVLAWLKQQGHTGTIEVHLLHGKPKSVDFPREPQRIILDGD